MPTRVALLSIHSSPLAPVGTEHAGGMNIYVRKLADEMAQQGLEVDVFTRRTSLSTPEIVPLPSGARIVHLTAGPAKPLPKSVLPLHIPSVVQAFRQFSMRERRSYDVLHSHYWLSGFVAARCRPDASIPIVHMFHTLSLVKELFHGGPDPHDSALRRDGERCVIGSADAIVGATAEEEEYMARLYGRSPRHFEIIPPGVDLDVFRPLDRLASRQELEIGSGKVILFVGRADKIKGLDTLLRVAADLKDRLTEPLRLVIVGTGSDRATRHSIESASARIGLQNMIDVRGTVTHDELPAFYSAADVLAMPSAYESFGMAAVEAMACGTPVVAFRVGGLAENVCDGLTGYLAAPGNRDELNRLLEKALTQPDMDRLGRQARLAANRFRWQNVVAQTLDLYDDLLHQRRFAFERVAGES